MSEITRSEDKTAIDASSEVIVTAHLHELISTIAKLPSLLKGPVRSIKIEKHYRKSRGKGIYNCKIRSATNKIQLMGDWIAETGLSSQKRIKVIPLQHLLIIIPDENF